jgi:hypothetical protein
MTEKHILSLSQAFVVDYYILLRLGLSRLLGLRRRNSTQTVSNTQAVCLRLPGCVCLWPCLSFSDSVLSSYCLPYVLLPFSVVSSSPHFSEPFSFIRSFPLLFRHQIPRPPNPPSPFTSFQFSQVLVVFVLVLAVYVYYPRRSAGTPNSTSRGHRRE